MMPERDTSKKSKWLLAGLLAVWAALSVHALLSLEDEGAAVCGRLVKSVEKYPSSQRPCRVVRYNDANELRSARRYQFEGDELSRVAFDRDGDGTYEDDIDCTYFGRVLIPVTDTGNWLGVTMSQHVERRSKQVEYLEQKSEEDGGERVVYFATTPAHQGTPLRRRDRRGDEGQLLERRFYVEGQPSPIRTLRLEYDESGRLVRVKRTGEGVTGETLTRLHYQGCAK